MTPRFPPLPARRADGSLPFTLDGDGGRLVAGNIAPFDITVGDFLRGFATTPHRAGLARGFLALRLALRAAGIPRGFHWIGGSYLRLKPQPRDIDVVTFLESPASWRTPETKRAARAAHPRLFAPNGPIANFGCDARFVEFLSPEHVARWSVYWSMVYGIEKASFARSASAPNRVGFLQIALEDDDDEGALFALDRAFPAPA